MDKNIKSRIQKLRDEIARLRFNYHVINDPKATDDVYESLTRELLSLEEKYPEYRDPNSSINRVAGEPLDKFSKITHKERMLSLNDVFSKDELVSWIERVSKLVKDNISYFCELKLDGLSASLIYENGVLISGATRGDGFIGEDVTLNLKMIESIPLVLKPPFPKYLEVRGEVIMPKRSWVLLNKEQEKIGKQTFANTRNAAAGSLRQLDPSIVKKRGLEFFAWDLILNDNNYNIKNHSDKHSFLRDLGFLMPPFEKKCNSTQDIFYFIDEVENKRQGLAFGTDGMVISIDDLNIQNRLGIVGKAPRYMVAYKYPAEKATTKVENITISVGRTGVLTPVAHFRPTIVAGSTVSKATLHNIDQINRLDIRIGDTAVIQKAGDVIPEVVEVLINLRTGKEKKFSMPKYCPICSSVVIKKENTLSSTHSVAYFCLNKNCQARNRRGLQHFINIFEIYEIGPKILDRLKDEGLISDAVDLFLLEESDLSGLERFGEKSAKNIISSIQNHKKISFWRFIYSLGIIHVGEETSRDLANHFETIDNLIKSKINEINEIENIGPIVALSVYNFFNDKNNISFIKRLFKAGVSIYYEQPKTLKLFGKVFVLTGTLSSMSREEAKKRIISNGGKISSSVSKNTSYVVLGDNPGSKYSDAVKLNVNILSETDFIKLLS